ncbi:amidase [Methylocapsa sp. S129]|uniref:amidase n=1 Tax=Methylocapsa sp. S129 TaxID=1641869 RepID=UPI00131C0F46|nr:amidase [Methylocapsa sp. S129]
MNDEPMTFADLRSAFGSSASSAEEIARSAFARIERDNGKLHAFVALDQERALADARHIDALRKLGVKLGPLAGAPIGIKDLIDVAGLPTRAGSLTRSDAAPATHDAPVVKRLRAAGAIIIGKTHTVEYAFGGWGTNETIGTPHNPRDMSRPRAPGGSSSGSGVAVAAGLCVAALGSDTGGSVRLPASFCGIVGLKTTAGLIDKSGVLPLTPMLDTIGPLTNCVADAAALLEVLAPAQDERSPGWTHRLNTIAYGQEVRISGLRIGVVANLGVNLHPDTARVLKQTRARLEALGAIQTEISLSQTLRDLAAPCGDLLAIEAYRLYGHLAEAESSILGAPVRKRILAGRDIPAHRLMSLFEDREEKKRELALLFERFDALLTPTTPFPAPLVAEIDESVSPGLLTRFVNYLDLTALSLPMGATQDGLPIGMQIVVPGYGEPTALEIGAALEADRGILRFGPAGA